MEAEARRAVEAWRAGRVAGQGAREEMVADDVLDLLSFSVLGDEDEPTAPPLGPGATLGDAHLDLLAPFVGRGEGAFRRACVAVRGVAAVSRMPRAEDVPKALAHAEEARVAVASDRPAAPLLLAAYLERALGDLWQEEEEEEGGAGLRPRMTKDLLASEHVQKRLGPRGHLFLRCVVGPPTSLNLRNLLWHGFLPAFSFDPRWTSLLAHLVCWCGSLLRRPHRQALRPAAAFAEAERVLERQAAALGWDAAPPAPGRLEAAAAASPHLAAGRLRDAEAAAAAWREGRADEAVALLAPVLESSLRLAHVAGGGHLGTLYAESDVLYTTLDAMLAEGAPAGRWLGDGLRGALADLLASRAGPRVREAVAHAEVAAQDTPRTAAALLVRACAELLEGEREGRSPPTLRRSWQRCFTPEAAARRALDVLQRRCAAAAASHPPGAVFRPRGAAAVSSDELRAAADAVRERAPPPASPGTHALPHPRAVVQWCRACGALLDAAEAAGRASSEAGRDGKAREAAAMAAAASDAAAALARLAAATSVPAARARRVAMLLERAAAGESVAGAASRLLEALKFAAAEETERP